MELHPEVLEPKCLDLLHRIQKVKTYENFYLVGGTALALMLGHRKSVDLDFFTHRDFDLTIIYQFPAPYRLINNTYNFIDLFSKGIKVTFMYFGYELYKPFIDLEKIKMIDPVDIGLMKLLAIQGRSTRKDIVDLYFIDKEIIKLEELLTIFESHFKGDSFNVYTRATNLFQDDVIEEDIEPEMLIEKDFKEAYEYVKEKVQKHILSLIEK